MEKTVEAICGLWTCTFEKPVCLKHCKKQRQDGGVYKNVLPCNLFGKKISFFHKSFLWWRKEGNVVREWQHQNEDLVVLKVQVAAHLLTSATAAAPLWWLVWKPSHCQWVWGWSHSSIRVAVDTQECGPRMCENSMNSEQNPCLVAVHVRSL